MMNKGEGNLKPTELKKLASMSIAAENYEDKVLGMQVRKEPKSIVEIVEMKMFEKNDTGQTC